MKRLALVAAAAAVVFAGCGGAGSQPVPHVVALDQAQPATAETDVTMPAITIPPEAVAAVAAPTADARATRPARASRSGTRTSAGGGSFDALAQCESGGNAQAVGGGGRYYGAFQFSLATWRSLGYSGSPTDHSYETQKAAAQRLVARSGWSQFPSCSRR